MNTQPMFLDSPLTFEGEDKYAGMLTKMSDNVDLWPQEIIQEAHKQLPYLSDFEANVVLDKVDEERGVAFGAIEARQKTELTTEELHTSPVRKVNIPIIIQDQMLRPFDVFLHGKEYEHLTEGRLRAALFRPDMFDAARERPHDASLTQDLHPPYQNLGLGSVKVGSVELLALPLLPQLQGQVVQHHVDRFHKLAEDPSLQAALANADEGVKAAFESAMTLKPADREKVAQVLSDSVKPTVVQIKAQPNGKYMLKWANSDMFAPLQEEIPQDMALDIAGSEDMVPELEGDGTLTLSPDAAVKETLEAEEITTIDQFGLWQVQDTSGNELVGWVFPKLLSMDMEPLPLALFNNGSQYALQDMIAGKLAGKSADIPKGIPKGYGALYFLDHGTAKAFVPMTVTSTTRGPDGNVKYMANLETGEQVTFSFADGLKAVIGVGEGEYVVPNDMSWMPLRGQTELVTNPQMFVKTGAQHEIANTVEIVSDGTTFSFRGPPIAKVAQEYTKFVNKADAEFLGVALGMSNTLVKEALERAANGCEVVTVPGVKLLGSPAEKLAAAKAKVKKALAELDPPIHNYFLMKEAAMLDDALSADKILGLGFLNAENISSFVDMLPALEETSKKLAELLVAVRVGLKDIPEVAVERMLKSLEDVIRGLKVLRQKEISERS